MASREEAGGGGQVCFPILKFGDFGAREVRGQPASLVAQQALHGPRQPRHDDKRHLYAKKILPDRVTPNPNVGRYFLTSAPDTGVAFYSYRSRRVSGSYELSFTAKPDWQKWLGRHRSAALWTADDCIAAKQRRDFRLINNPASLSALLPADAAGNTRRLGVDIPHAGNVLFLRFAVGSP